VDAHPKLSKTSRILSISWRYTGLLHSPLGASKAGLIGKHAARSRPWSPPRSAFVEFRFPAAVIVVAVRWYLRYGLPYRDVEELLAERKIAVDHAYLHPASGGLLIRGL
jgi:hypothetical protein